MSCDAIQGPKDHTNHLPFFPGRQEDAGHVVDWWGVNVFNKDPKGLYNSMPNSSCVLDFIS